MALIVLNSLQKAVLEQRPGLPDGADTDHVKPPGPRTELGADAGRQGSDMPAQHPPRLPEQPPTQSVPSHGGLGNLPGESSELGLAEVVVAVSQQTKPAQSKP